MARGGKQASSLVAGARAWSTCWDVLLPFYCDAAHPSFSSAAASQPPFLVPPTLLNPQIGKTKDLALGALKTFRAQICVFSSVISSALQHHIPKSLLDTFKRGSAGQLKLSMALQRIWFPLPHSSLPHLSDYLTSYERQIIMNFLLFFFTIPLLKLQQIL